MHEMPANTGCTGLFDRSWACPEPKKILGNIRNACEKAVSGPRKLAKVQLRPRQDGSASLIGLAHVAFDYFHGLRSCDMPISWLDHKPHAIAVYASWPALPSAHATLATGRPAAALPGPVLHRLDCTSFCWRLRRGRSASYPAPPARIRTCTLMHTTLTSGA